MDIIKAPARERAREYSLAHLDLRPSIIVHNIVFGTVCVVILQIAVPAAYGRERG